MDHDQQVQQLVDFSQQQAGDAATFATKSFLETLIDLINYSLEKQDDGTDSYKEDLKIMKDSVKAFSTVLPTVYKTICQNEAETRLWELCRSLITLVDSQLVTHPNTGVQINAVKCLQVLVLLLSKSAVKDVSLNLLRPDHRLLNTEELEKEGQQLFEKIMEKLKADNESVLTATISCLAVIAKRRPQFAKEIIKAFSSWKKDKDDSPVMLRNVNKALKLAFITMIRTDSLAAFRPEMMTAFGAIGGNVAMFQSRQSREQESRRLKRQQQQQQQENERHEREKRARTEYVPIIPSASAPNILVNYDITQIPLDAIVSLCMTVLQTVPLEVMSERVSILPPQGVTLAATRPGFVRSSTPPYPPPPDQPKYNTNPRYKTEEELHAATMTKGEPVKIKRENPEDSDEEMVYNAPPAAAAPHHEEQNAAAVKKEEKPREVLASVEERASQAFKMKPYELEKQQTELSDFEKRELLKMSIQRIFDAENMFQTSGNMLMAGSSTTSTSSVWLLRMVKLITHGISQPPTTEEDEQPTEEEKEEDRKGEITTVERENELKDLLLNFIVGNLSLRTDLALEWLHEEYLCDKRANTAGRANYFYWFHKFLKKGIPTLDAKDRVLTKLLLEAPELNEETIELVKENLYNVPQRFVPCVSTLRSLVTNRPAIRSLALQVLLDICTNENDNMRRTGLVAVKKYDQPDIHTKVEEFSVKALNVLATPKDVEMNGEGGGDESDKEWSSKDVLRHAELYFVSCNKRPSLLKELFPVYIKSSEQVQNYIQLHMVNMIKSIGMKSLVLNKLLSEFPPGGESLVIKIISILCESKPPTREIISVVQTISEIAKERSIDIESLAPILEGRSLSEGQATTTTTTTTAAAAAASSSS